MIIDQNPLGTRSPNDILRHDKLEGDEERVCIEAVDDEN